MTQPMEWLTDELRGMFTRHPDDPPMKVEIVSTRTEVENKAPEFGSYFTLVVNTGDPAQQVLPQAELRDGATINYGGADDATKYVLLGTQQQIQNGQGFRLYSGKSISIGSVPAVFVVAGVASMSAVLSVLDEKYRPGK